MVLLKAAKMKLKPLRQALTSQLKTMAASLVQLHEIDPLYCQFCYLRDCFNAIARTVQIS